MYCNNCGAWNPQESKFCAKCGKPVSGAPATIRDRWMGPGLVVLIVGALLVVIAVLAAILVRDQLARVWQGGTAQPTPTEIAVLPTATPTRGAVPATATPSLFASPSPTTSEVPTPVATSTPTSEPTPIQRTFMLVYRECIPPGLALGSVKGQVFDKAGRVIPGAKVRITIDGYEWQSDANPATTNSAGWYEWILEVGQKVQFVELIVDGRSVPFSPQGFEVKASGGCFQQVDFIEQ